MSFGQSSGAPATSKQLKELLALLEAAGHNDFRDAWGPMGFTQRQAAGKFTRDEADAFIESLQTEQDSGESPAAPAVAPKVSAVDQALKRFSAEQLAAELQRRGWIVVEP